MVLSFSCARPAARSRSALVGLTALALAAALALDPLMARAEPTAADISGDRAPLALDEIDRIAALESVQVALSEVGDGASYVWHRAHGRLSGLVQPTGSFKSAHGAPCRHVVVMLVSGTRSRSAEGVACRLPSGQWRLEG